MSDDHPRNRHRDGAHHPTDGVDPDRLKFFTQPPSDGKPTTRHRRRRTPTSPGTDTFAAERPEESASPDVPMRDSSPWSDSPVRPSGAARRDGAIRPTAAVRPSETRSRPVRPSVQGSSPSPAGSLWQTESDGARPHVERSREGRGRPERNGVVSERSRAERTGTAAGRGRDKVSKSARQQALSAEASNELDLDPGTDATTTEQDQRRPGDRRSGDRRRDWGDQNWRPRRPDGRPDAYTDDRAEVGRATRLVPESADPGPSDHLVTEPGFDHADPDHADHVDPDLDHPDLDDSHHGAADYREPGYPEHLFGEGAAAAAPTRTASDAGRRGRGRRPGRDAATRKRRRIVLAVVIACLLALIGSVGYVGMRASGMFVNTKDYTNAAGTADVIVDLPENSTIAEFGTILEQSGVVGSVNSFVRAAGNEPMSGGYYKLRTQIPAATAVEMITDGDNTHRVGRLVVPEGLQLDSKTGIDGKTTSGIFQRIEDATAVTVNGRREGVTVDELQKAAAADSASELGIPQWAESAVTEMTGDHRRVEGLIAPGTWEAINPTGSPTQILRDLIAASATRYEQWGLLNDNGSGLTPYQTLVAASVVEREVTKPEDYSKVSRVILNRLAKDQRLEMDSTSNYTADITNIDVFGDAYKADNKWNTYRNKGLPVTPIGAVGERALTAVEHPANGSWLYFVTVDRKGTTLFANTFEEHQRNRDKACENKLLSTGCS